ncbi:response regulator transcription factor [Qipengyuania qiaonensis]|uniref:Response regulator transcription factor n=1 Tax=Qipengyuania qiaonensis TaxID=2867240 RepID=A0ABS7JDN3_9SPHN|nr:response regulator transcription factor [Qipengyuania qiaonensis]
MRTINIFLTDPIAGELPDFENGDIRYAFARLYPEGPKRLVEGPVCAFVDWVMEDLSGLEMCRRLRSDPRMEEAHVTIVLEDDDAEDKRRALRAGADDYLVGPIDRTIVLDRVMALQSGSGQPRINERLELGALLVDLAALQARWAGQPLDLRPNEFRLLHFLAQNPDRVLSRGDLIAALGKQEPPIDERTVDVWVGRLRRALRAVGAGERVRTVRSLGYVYDSYD